MDFTAQLTHVTKSYGDVVGVSDISFQIPTGEITGFLGPNGSGKTTSIKMILGLTKPNTGNIEVLGSNPFKNDLIKYDIGYVPENDCFYRWITAFDFLNQYSEFYLPREEAKKRTWDILEEVGLAHVAKKRIQTFSKGMKQRIKLGQTIIHNPKFVISDEPFNGLDPIVRKQFFEIMHKYSEEFSTTWFVSSHVLFEVEQLAQNIILLYKGRTIAQGSPSRIRALIQEQPHKIKIVSHSIKELIKLLVDQTSSSELITTLEFPNSQYEGNESITVETNNPTSLYQLVTDLVVEYNLTITEIKPTDEGLEALFKTLTVG